jgi:uncharacterized membrane protein HdeD (DUF308 family)
MSIQATIEAGENYLAHVWKAIATLGVTSIVFGVVLLVWPDLGLATMTALVGTFGLVYGSLSAYATFRLPKESGRLRLWVAIQAIIGIGTGVVVLVWPDLSATALLYAIAIWAIAGGIAQVGGAITLPLRTSESLLVALNGIVLGAFGVIMFVEPGEGALALLTLVAAFAIVHGIFEVALARELRGVVEDVKERSGPLTRAKPLVHG